MAQKSQKRVEPGFSAGQKPKEVRAGMRGERLDVASEDEDEPKSKRAGRKSARSKTADDPPPAERRRKGRPKRRSLLGAFVRWSATFAIWGLLVILGVVAYYSYDLPDVGNFAALSRRPSITLVGDDGKSFASFGDLYSDIVPVKEMSPYLPKAVIATEDRRFYDHFGIDPIGILRAIVEDIRTHRLRQGGSTITQQLAKNLFLTPERTIKRKVQEVLLALWLEHKFTKDQILTIYLNRVYLGSGAYGVEAASRKYFGKSARDLSLYESAVLAGLLKAPSKFNPVHDPELTAQRTGQVLLNMVDAGYITPEQASNASRQSTLLEPVATAAWRGRYFADWAMDQVRDLLGYIDRDLVVVTTLDPKLQEIAENTLDNVLEKEGAKLDIGQGALVALGPDGEVRALVGGRDYRKSQFNRAVQALRQPGSAFKPFVYLAGLEAGFGEESVFNDAPITIGNWSPHNYDGKYFGRVTLKEALTHSLNSVAAQLAEKAGINRVIDVAHRLGITADLRKDASIALGTSEVSLLELTAAYGAFANGGKGIWPYGIVEIQDRDGHVLYKRTGSGPGQVMTSREAAAMVDMMESVIAKGTGRAAAIGRPAAGKTGTTQDYRDALFVGFTPGLITGVWVGNDDRTPMKKVTGGRVPAVIWHDFMSDALKGAPVREFPKAPTVIESVLKSILGSPEETRGAPPAPKTPPAFPFETKFSR